MRLTLVLLLALPLTAARAPELNIDGHRFRDLNRNGRLDPYEDRRRPVAERVADLLSQMTLEEKAGLLFHASLQGFTGPNGIVLDAPAPRAGNAPPPLSANAMNAVDHPSPQDLLLRRHVRWVLTRPSGEPIEDTARFANNLQEIAESSRLGIPLVISSDPRHTPRPGAFGGNTNLSAWPEQLAFAAIGDPARVREFGRIAALEYRAAGIRAALHPMADLATEPRWARIAGTFGEDAKLAGPLLEAYIEGFQGGKQLTPASVMTVVKHFPGDGPLKDGLDPHNSYGQFQIYPGKNFDHHLLPFERAFAAGAAGVMPAYAIPTGIDTVAMGYSKKIVGDLLRGKYKYDGLVVTDWLIARMMPWGVENLSIKQRHQLIIEAGCDQIGGENDPSHIIALVRDGALSQKRLDESARRALKPLFEMGLFENPYVDAQAAKRIVASAAHNAAGRNAQRDSIVLLKNSRRALPFEASTARVYLENVSKDAAARVGLTAVDKPEAATINIIKVTAPYQILPGGTFRIGAHEGALTYAGAANAAELAAIERLAATGKPTIVAMYLERPAILSEFLDKVDGVIAHFGSGDEAILEVLAGKHSPRGKLPVNLPRDMASVFAQQADVPHDLKSPLFPFGFGLRYSTAK